MPHSSPTSHPKPTSFPFELIKRDLEQVETLIREQIHAFDPQIEPYISYICNTNGKRIRPALAILVGQATGKLNPDHLKIGVILELIHMATLVHDDVIDGAETRRNLQTPNSTWGNGMAVLLGDALFSHALSLATDFNSIDICRKVGFASREVCQGEILQTKRRFDPTLTKTEYFRIVEMKTGALFAAASALAANLSGCSKTEEQKMYNFGLQLGTAYQIYDDCLDLVGEETQVGKTLRTDLTKGKLTLPLLEWLERLPEQQQNTLKANFHQNQSLADAFFQDPNALKQALHISIDTALTRLAICRENLSIFPTSPARNALEQITYFLDALLQQTKQNVI